MSRICRMKQSRFDIVTQYEVGLPPHVLSAHRLPCSNKPRRFSVSPERLDSDMVSPSTFSLSLNVYYIYLCKGKSWKVTCIYIYISCVNSPSSTFCTLTVLLCSMLHSHQPYFSFSQQTINFHHSNHQRTVVRTIKKKSHNNNIIILWPSSLTQ